MLTIRLSRIGKKNKPMYRLVISEKARDPYGRALEILGSYNPYTKDLQAKAERINHWLSLGAGMSATVNNLLIEKGIVKGEKIKATKVNKKKKEEEKKKEESKAEKKEEKKSEEKAPVETSKEKPKMEEKKEEKEEESAPKEAGSEKKEEEKKE